MTITMQMVVPPPSPDRTTVTFQAIPGGRAGARATLRIMAKMVAAGKTDIRVRQKTLSLTRFLPGKNWVAEAQSIFYFVRDQVRYVRDVAGVETIATPSKTLEYMQGDCDDKSVLAAAMLQSIDHPARLVAVGFNGEPLSHVFVETMISDKWVPMELTEQLLFGQAPNGITDFMVQPIPL